MSHSGGIITASVDFERDIAAVLVVDSGDMETLYNHASVNMFSLKKPVDWHDSATRMDLRRPQINHPNDWFRAKLGDCGLRSKTFTDSTNLKNLITGGVLDGGLNGWEYVRDPENYRALDFDGYYHYARNPFDALELRLDGDVVEFSPGATIRFLYRNTRAGETSTIEVMFSDIKCTYNSARYAIDDMYFGFVIYSYTNGTYTWVAWRTASEKVGLMDSVFRDIAYELPTTEGKYRIVPIITFNQYNAHGQIQEGAGIIIPKVNFTEITVARSVAAAIFIDAFYLPDYNYPTSDDRYFGSNLYYYIQLKARSNQDTNFNAATIYFETQAGGWVSYLRITDVQNAGDTPTTNQTAFPTGAKLVSQNTVLRLPSTYNTIVWSQLVSSASMTFANFIRNGGRARITASATGSSGPLEYIVQVRPAAGI